MYPLLIGVLLDIVLFLLTLTCLPLVLLVVIPLYAWRQTVKVLARLFKANELGAMLSPTDATFMPFESPETKGHPSLHLNPDSMVCNLVICQGRVDVDSFRARAAEDILSARGPDGRRDKSYVRFQQHVTSWLGYAFFKWDQTFDIADHIRVVNEPVTEGTVNEFVRTRLHAPWRKGHSMWEVDFVHNYNGEDKTLCAFRFSHVVADGLSIIQMCRSRMQPERKGPDSSRPCQKPLRQIPFSMRLKNVYFSTVGLPRLFLKEVVEMRRNGYVAQRLSVAADDYDMRWISRTNKISLADIKRLKSQAGISFSEAMNTAISAAVGNHFTNCLGVKDKWIPGATIVPVPGRPEEGLVNAFGIVGLAISLDKDSNTLCGRLEATRATFRHAVSPAMQLSYAVQTGIKSLPLPILQRIPPPNIAFLYTNVPGPTEEIIMFDNLLLDNMFWLKARKASPVIMFSILSYNGTVQIGVTACSTFVKSQEQMDRITEDVQEELQYMMTLKSGVLVV